ncbi:response regulator [Luteimonas sp. e5]
MDPWKFLRRRKATQANGGRYKVPDRRRKPRLSSTRGLRVLVIDDSAQLRQQLRDMLRDDGYLVAEAGDLASGRQRLIDFEPGLLFIDMLLPDGDGFSEVRELRRLKHVRDLPIVMMSGSGFDAERRYGDAIGIDGFIRKPLVRGDVFACLDRLISSGRLPRRNTGPRPPAHP